MNVVLLKPSNEVLKSYLVSSLSCVLATRSNGYPGAEGEEDHIVN